MLFDLDMLYLLKVQCEGLSRQNPLLPELKSVCFLCRTKKHENEDQDQSCLRFNDVIVHTVACLKVSVFWLSVCSKEYC